MTCQVSCRCIPTTHFAAAVAAAKKKGELDLTILGSENPKLTGNKPPLLTAE